MGTDQWRLIPDRARLLQIDIDPQEVGRNYEAMRLQGDARATLLALVDALQQRDLAKRKSVRADGERRIAKAWKAFEADRASEAHSKASPIRPERIMAAIQKHLDGDTIVV